MNFQIIPFEESVLDWWDSKNPSKPTTELLPDTTYIVRNENENLASGCIYFVKQSKICFIDNVISNPRIQKSLRAKAIDFLFKFLESKAKSEGYSVALLFPYIDGLKHRAQELGYVVTRENISVLGKVL